VSLEIFSPRVRFSPKAHLLISGQIAEKPYIMPVSLVSYDIETMIILGAAVVSTVAHRHSGRGYAIGKDTAIASPNVFRVVYRYVQASTLIAALGAIYIDSFWLFKIPRPGWLSLSGSVLTLTSLVIFLHAKRILGHAYSPCFDSFVPQRLVMVGIYRYVRHPIYTANLALLTGIFLTSGSLWVAFNVILLLPFYFSSSRAEEGALQNRFSEYASYAARTGGFLPRLHSLRRG
jgi:protein-S-isoprenylcysteine O-methyltransferase Ste14